jgi:hypothetical protein
MRTDPSALQSHARELAVAFKCRLVESSQLEPHEAFASPRIRVVFCHPVIDETTYAVALHELGHLAAPLGVLTGIVPGDPSNLCLDQEDAAWEWARHYALVWTPAMQAVRSWAEGTYQRAFGRGPVAAPKTPPPPQRIDWSKYK